LKNKELRESYQNQSITYHRNSKEGLSERVADGVKKGFVDNSITHHNRKRPLGRPRQKWEDGVKKYVMKVRPEMVWKEELSLDR